MKVKLYLRVKGGWQDVDREMTPAELKPLRRELRAKCAARLAAKPDANKFKVTPIGELTYGSASGTLTELAEAGICIGCLGGGRDIRWDGESRRDHGQCDHCQGSGDNPEVNLQCPPSSTTAS